MVVKAVVFRGDDGGEEVGGDLVGGEGEIELGAVGDEGGEGAGRCGR